MQSRKTVIEEMALRIRETGEGYKAGETVTWLVPSAYEHSETVQCKTEATAADVQAAERLCRQWQTESSIRRAGVRP